MYIKKGKLVFSNKDMWDLDAVLSPILFTALTQFRDTQMGEDGNKGTPGLVFSEIFSDKSMEEYTEEDYDLASKRWMEIVNQMIYAFDPEKEPDITAYKFKFNPVSFYEPTEDMVEKKVKHMLPLSVDNESEHERYRKDQELWGEKKREGLALFAKYFECLWS